nr:attacin-B-like [Onthophagus taurus]
MKGFIFFFVFVASSVFAYEIVSDGEQEYLLVPLDSGVEATRTKRQTSGIYDSASKRGTITHTGTLLNNNNHNLMGTGAISGGKHQPVGIGGGLDYTHKPSASTFSASANHLRGFGTDVGASGRYNFVNKPNTQAYVGGNYNRHFGGPFGTGRPNYGAFVGLTHRF